MTNATATNNNFHPLRLVAVADLFAGERVELYRPTIGEFAEGVVTHVTRTSDDRWSISAHLVDGFVGTWTFHADEEIPCRRRPLTDDEC